MPKDLFTTNEAAKELGITPARVRQMILSNELKAEKIGRDLVVKAKDLATARSRKTIPGPASAKKPQRTKTSREKTGGGDRNVR